MTYISLLLQLMVASVEFNNAGCLLISEVKYLLENREKDPPDTACVAIVSHIYLCTK